MVCPFYCNTFRSKIVHPGSAFRSFTRFRVHVMFAPCFLPLFGIRGTAWPAVQILPASQACASQNRHADVQCGFAVILAGCFVQGDQLAPPTTSHTYAQTSTGALCSRPLAQLLPLMLGRGCGLSRLLRRGCSEHQAVLASAYASSAAAAPASQHSDAAAQGSGAAEQVAAVTAGLQRLKEQLAAGPDLGDFVAGDTAADGEGRAAPYSVYAPSFKVRHHDYCAER